MRGEIQHISDHRSGHLYMDLVDPGDEGASSGSRARGGEPTLKVKCWRSSWAPLRHRLAKEGIELAEGMVVVLRGTLDVYRAKGEISFVLAEVDVTALLGRMAAQRALLLRKLEDEGLLGRNASLRVPEVTMHVGLIASPGTEGYQDFLGQLTGSGFGFHVSFVPVSVQGPGAPAAITRALKVLSRSDCDVIAVVRGGGREADLAAFETEVVARAVAGAAKPVFTGIGHSGDQSVADIVAGAHLHHADRVRAPDRRGDPALVGDSCGGAGGAAGAARPGVPRRRPGPRRAGAGPPDRGGAAPGPGAPGSPRAEGLDGRPHGAEPHRVAARRAVRAQAARLGSGEPRAPGS